MKYYNDLIKKVKDIPNDIANRLRLNEEKTIEVETSIGDLSGLSTKDKSSIVNAINEVVSIKNIVKCSIQVTIDSSEPAIGQTIIIKNMANNIIQQKVISSLYTEFELNYGVEYDISLDNRYGFTTPKNILIKPYIDTRTCF